MTPAEPTIGRTVQAALAGARARLAAAGLPEPATDARLLLEAATGLDRARQLARRDRPLGAAECAAFDALVGRRLAHEPLAYILGTREFMGLDFAVGPGVLIPRPDTETLVETALRRAAAIGVPRRILDIGTGSGCIILSLLHHLPGAVGLGTDRSAAALAVAARNRAALGLETRCLLSRMDWAQAAAPVFDLIVSNPPYIPSGAIAELEPEVASFEPRAALDGGADGLHAYRAVTPVLQRCLVAGGRVLLEIGAGQEGELAAWFAAAGFAVHSHRDLAGRQRVLELLPRHHRAFEAGAGPDMSAR